MGVTADGPLLLLLLRVEPKVLQKVKMQLATGYLCVLINFVPRFFKITLKVEIPQKLFHVRIS